MNTIFVRQSIKKIADGFSLTPRDINTLREKITNFYNSVEIRSWNQFDVYNQVCNLLIFLERFHGYFNVFIRFVVSTSVVNIQEGKRS